MFAILGITAPIFILIAIGFFSCRSGLVSRDQTVGMGRFVISFALPALVIKALLERPLAEVVDWNYLLGYGLGSLLTFGLGFIFARKVRKDTASGSALVGLGMSVSNSGFVGYPIVAIALGSPAAVALALGMMIENLLMIPLALTLAELGRQSASGLWPALRGTLANLVRHPILIAITLALLLAVFELRPPAVIMRVIDMLALASAPVALFVIGASLYGMKASGLALDVGQMAIGKLIVHPLMILLCFTLIPVSDPVLASAGVLMAAAPMMSIYPILGARYGLEGRCAASLVAATVLSFLSISLFIWAMT
ncbi:AEC family transporter [Pseudomonas stutzeri]|uniref:AEC family transporter n=1 Tax=Stutzerimonas stutzeri TaxID=316 RepID=UPI00210CB802|nr:AEC family transporter [Stutzerimonas stutzeri]MCQ4311913.1 AEC family transporter [Stutzerimonas stutzeri]